MMQTTDTLLMIEPVAFGFNPQTAVNNYFQVQSAQQDIQEKALKEFQAFSEQLQDAGIRTIVIKDTPTPHTPDSIFPNNWVSFHSDGRVVLYPMFAENRRLERRTDIIDHLQDLGFEVKNRIDYTASELEGAFLEGTGSMIFDHDHKIAYGSVSLRLDEALFRSVSSQLGFTPIVFHSYQNVSGERLPIYHTNVMMCIADQYAVICLDCIDDPQERQLVEHRLKESGKEIICITEAQMHQFAGNMLQVRNLSGEPFLVMSKRAHESLNQDQILRIEHYNTILSADLQTIEDLGGGSARCMLAEVFLPKISS